MAAMKSAHDGMTWLLEDKSMLTIDDETGAITIDIVAYGPVRIVMTAEGDIEVEGRSILNTVHWTNYSGAILKQA
jgi:hypothetical protein